MSADPQIKPASKKFSDLKIRAVSGVLILLICLIPIYFGGIVFTIFAALIAARIAYEWVRMSDVSGGAVAYGLMIICIVGAVFFAWQQYWPAMWGVVVLGAVTTALERMRRGGASWAFFGFLYLAIPCIAMVFIRTGLYADAQGWSALGFRSFMWIALIVMAADTGAYLGGSMIGGPKMAPKLSPKKTWAGFFSGLVLGALIGFFSTQMVGVESMHGLLLAIPVVVLSVIGDFLESGIKRKLNVKDTGRILPGHGGVLDRIDSLMFAMAAFAGLALLLPFIGA